MTKKTNAEDKPGFSFPDAKILIVDDDKITIDVVKLFLKNCCNIQSVYNATDAINSLIKDKIDIIFMDINLGIGKNGIEAVKQIKKMPGYEKTPIIALTAYAMHGDKEVFLNAGCTHYISKPFEKNDLINLVNGILQK